MSRTIQTHSHTAHANTSESISTTNTHCAATLSALTSTRCFPNSVSQFKGFSAQGSSTPTCYTPDVFIEKVGDDQEDYALGDSSPGDDSPDGNDPNGDDLSDNDPQPDDNDNDNDNIDDDEQSSQSR